jgi:hypothetical protein
MPLLLLLLLLQLSSLALNVVLCYLALSAFPPSSKKMHLTPSLNTKLLNIEQHRVSLALNSTLNLTNVKCQQVLFSNEEWKAIKQHYHFNQETVPV